MLNVTHLTVMSQTNRGDLKAIAEEHCSVLDPEETFELMKVYLKGKHDFITFNYNNSPAERMVDKDFNVINIPISPLPN
jgi:hypothetical protein